MTAIEIGETCEKYEPKRFWPSGQQMAKMPEKEKLFWIKRLMSTSYAIIDAEKLFWHMYKWPTIEQFMAMNKEERNYFYDCIKDSPQIIEMMNDWKLYNLSKDYFIQRLDRMLLDIARTR